MAFSVDTIVDRYMPHPAITGEAFFSPDQAVTDCAVHVNPSSDELVVIVPPWHANKTVQDKLAQRQVQLGHSVLSYSFHDDMLTADSQQTISAFESVSERIATDVERIDVPNKHYIGSSLGAAVATHILGEYSITAKATLIASGGDLATSLWSGIRTQHLRRAFEEQGIDLADLQHAWEQLSPTYQAIHNIRNSHFTMYISAADRVIRPDTNPMFVNALRTTGNRVALHNNRFLGHYGTILRRSLIGNL